MDYIPSEDGRSVFFPFELEDNRLVAVKSRYNGILFFYPREWDSLYLMLSANGRLYLNYISREFPVIRNCIYLNEEFVVPLRNKGAEQSLNPAAA